jgi:hypothetical protein
MLTSGKSFGLMDQKLRSGMDCTKVDVRSGQATSGVKNVCGRDFDPHGRLSPTDFLTVYGFRRLEARPSLGSRQVCGLDCPFIPAPKLRGLGAARLVSTPSRLDCGFGSRLPFEVSPTLSGSASPVSLASTQGFLRSAAYAIPPRPRAAA